LEGLKFIDGVSVAVM